MQGNSYNEGDERCSAPCEHGRNDGGEDGRVGGLGDVLLETF